VTISRSIDLELIPQPDEYSCWAASMAMIVGHATGSSISPEQIAKEAGAPWERTFSDRELLKAVAYWKLLRVPDPAYPGDWQKRIDSFGPIFMVIEPDLSFPASSGVTHAVVLKGYSGDTFYYHDPWPPKRGKADVAVSHADLGNHFAWAKSQTPDFLRLLHRP